VALVLLPGLTARLDKLIYHHGGSSLPPDKPHAFVYFITIHNGSDRASRCWAQVGDRTRGRHRQLVIEGDKIVGETPRLAPGEQFSYNSYHVTGEDATCHGSFHGVDEQGGENPRHPAAVRDDDPAAPEAFHPDRRAIPGPRKCYACIPPECSLSFPGIRMKLIDLNRDGGIGANSLFVQLGDLRIFVDCGLNPKQVGPSRHAGPSPPRGKSST
jgi:ApaG protein